MVCQDPYVDGLAENCNRLLHDINLHKLFVQIQGNIHPHAIIILPNTSGMELLLTYEDEGVYVDIYGHFTKENVLQWGEMPASVGTYEK